MLLIQILLLILFLVISYYLGYQIISLAKVKIDKTTKIRNFFWSWFLGITIPSLIISLINVWFKLPINTTTVWSVYGIMMALSLFNFVKPKKSTLVSFLKQTKILWLVFFLAFGLMLYLRFSSQSIIGGDTVTYVYRSAVILDTGFSINNYDRNIIHNLPIVLTYMTGFELIAAFKISISLLFAVSALSLYALAESLKLKYAIWAVWFGVISIPLLRLYSDIIAFSFGITGLVVMTQLLISLKDKPSKSRIWLLLLVSFGIQFSLHGLLSYSLPLFVGPILLDILWSHRQVLIKNKYKCLTWIILTPIIFGIISQPSTSQWGHIYLRNLKNIFGINQIIQTSTSSSGTINPDQVDADLAVTSPQLPKDLDYLTLSQNYYENYSPLFLLIGILGYVLIGLFYQKPHSRYIGYFFLVIFLLTQQNFLDLNWWPTRFVLAMYLPFSVLNVFLVEKLSQFSKHQQLFVFGSFGILSVSQLMYLKAPPILGYKFNLHPIRYEFLKAIETNVPIDTPIIDFSTSPSWTKVLNPYHNIKIIDNNNLCSANPSPTNMSLYSQLHHKTLEATTASELLANHVNSQDFYVIFDVLNTCLNQNLFTKEVYEVVDYSRSLRLLRGRGGG